MATWQEFLSEARRFWEVAETAYDPDHINQAASQAIHAVIAANDALCMFLIQDRPAGESHTQAVQFLRRACAGTEWEQEAATRVRQFADVLQLRSAVEYQGRPIKRERAERLMKQAKRFVEWAETVLPLPDSQ